MSEGIRSEMAEIGSNGGTLQAFVARPEGDGPYPGVIVVQEWWGLNDNIKDIAQRFAGEGFVALAPDLYHGRVTPEPDEAMKLMMALDMNRASREVTKGADYLAAQPYTAGRGIGATGFCMGGGLALTLACDSPHVKAVAPFYGGNPNPVDKVQNISGPVLAIYAENDNWITPAVREELSGALERHGKRFEIRVYPGTHHGFFNDTQADVHDAAASADAWQRVLALFRENL